MSVPPYRIRGQVAILECDYELDNDGLYSVKWYRDNEEFYRYMPKFDPPKHAYKLDGVKVDVSIITFIYTHNYVAYWYYNLCLLAELCTTPYL